MRAERLRAVVWRLLAVAVGLALSAGVMALTGNDITGFVGAIADGFGSNLDSTLRWFAPLLLAGVAGAIAFRDGALNLGLDGQIFIGGAASATVAIVVGPSLPPAVVLVFAVAAGIVGGALVAGFAGLLRLWFGTPEVITTLVLNPLCALFVTWLAGGPLAAESAGGNTESSAILPPALWLPSLAPGSLASVAVYLAVGVLVATGVYYAWTTWGFESRVFGASPQFAFYAGIPNVRVYFRAMLASGGIAGLVGAGEVLGVQHRLAKGFNPGLGFDGIAVALVAGLSIVGLAFSALLFALLRQAGEVAQITLGIPAELVDVMIALIILTTSVPAAVFWHRRSRRRRESRSSAAPPTPPSRQPQEDAPAHVLDSPQGQPSV
ncbi:hypothetical protein ASF88_16700 [Leifsonia sp. Leaf336]|uniref:ABC transporter permease n=1 Tax=Leifsonia sp. Leaf336 TaxID=1736341 RepID=UPI000713A452|nr:ABC transporter permease [Leifsonia sp. Leaf336]KQR50866.1 hypothetical protein ASF88_16700 [Leifsonia sp. Leaf336]